jgi:uncharacterized protein YdhG (YjbR/CyaY superfamily)
MNPDKIQQLLDNVSSDRKPAVEKLLNTIRKNIPEDFEETVNYGMIGFVVPLSLYSAGYHCNPKEPLPFINLASTKSHIAIYHMGIYADPKLLEWFTENYLQITGKKPDMGKSCIRFKKPELIPYDLIGELVQKMSAKEWIALYERQFKK